MGTHPIIESDFDCLTVQILYDLLKMPPYYSDTNSESSSREDENDSNESTDDEPQEPSYSWNNNRRAGVNDHGSTIFWCDGACKGNHLGPDGGATSGVGVWVNKRKYWKKFNYVYRHTNNFAELYSIQVALEKIAYAIDTGKNRWGLRFEFRLDSQYAVDCMNDYSYTWRYNGWKKTDGTDVVHKIPIQKILAMIDQYNLKVWFIWIPREGL